MPRDSFAFTVDEIAPPDNTFRDAGEEVHRLYWRYIVEQVLELKDASLAKGLDRFGQRMTGIAASTRARGLARSYTGLGDPDAPPLTPAYGLSRTRALFRGRAYADRAEFFWAYDEVSRQPWGRILGYHREGGPHFPVRDVIGLAPADLAEAERRGMAWWYHYQEGARLAEGTARLGLPQPLTERIPPPKFVVEGDVDIDQYTFGIGADEERTRRAIAEGYHSGFKRRIGGMPTITKLKGGSKPTPPATPVPAPPPTPPQPFPMPRAAPQPPPPGGPGPAHTIPRAVAHIEAEGVDVEPQGHAETVSRYGTKRAARIALFYRYDADEKKIYINERHPYWQNPAAVMKELHEKGDTSTAEADHLLHHELAHPLHHRDVGNVRYAMARNIQVSAGDRKRFRNEVSERATKNPNELVAEVYAGLAAGRTFSSKLMKLYRSLGGPSLPIPNSPRPVP